MTLIRAFLSDDVAAIIELAALETGNSPEQLIREILGAWTLTYHPRRRE